MTTQLGLMDKDLGNKVATWNVRGIARKMEELQTELLKRKTDIAIITETKKKNKGSEDRQLCNNLLWGTR